MCTLIAFQGVWDDAPLVIAVNRDEAYDRPAAPPAWCGSEPRVLMPRDERAGGTWMGATDAGLWVGLTNRHGSEDPTRRSRGLLCLDLLGSTDAAAIADRVAALREPYNPFNLVAGDLDRGLQLTQYADGRARTRWLGPGCHIVTNRPYDETGDEPKVTRARSLLAAAGLWPREVRGGPAPSGLVQTLGAILADHGRRGPDALCLHGGGYGTRSAAVWRIEPPRSGEVSSTGRVTATVVLAYADGPPCATPFEGASEAGSTTS